MKTSTKSLITLGTAGALGLTAYIGTNFEIGRYNTIRANTIKGVNVFLENDKTSIKEMSVCTLNIKGVHGDLSCSTGSFQNLSIPITYSGNHNNTDDILILGMTVINGQLDSNSGCIRIRALHENDFGEDCKDKIEIRSV